MTLRRVVGCTVFVAVGIACLAPTQFTINIFTDLPCENVGKTEIFFGADEAKLRGSGDAPTAETAACHPRAGANSIGSIVAVPSHTMSDRFALRVLLSKRTDNGIADCSKGIAAGCIESWRTAGFVAHSSLSISITLSKACENQICLQGKTCVDGKCVDDTIDQTDSDAGLDDAPSDAAMDAAPDSPMGSGCNSPAECKLSQNCTCECIPLERKQPDPVCMNTTCSSDPCMNKTATCTNNVCSVQ